MQQLELSKNIVIMFMHLVSRGGGMQSMTYFSGGARWELYAYLVFVSDVPWPAGVRVGWYPLKHHLAQPQ